MNSTYAKKTPSSSRSGKETCPPEENRASVPMSSLRAMAGNGGAKPLDLSDTIRTKMENAFGMDLGSVRLYESQAVAEHGAGAVAQGDTIVFAPGQHDFTSRSGQEVLGHELSHVASQRRGEVTGSGFLNSPALEARADREGALAAAGEQVYGGPVAGPLSGVTADAAAAGPMQAWGKKKNEAAQQPREFESTQLQAAEAFFGVGNGGEYDTWSAGLKQSERDALRDYTKQSGEGNYKEVNGSLRTGEWVVPGRWGTHNKMTPDQEKRAKAQRKAMDHALSKANLSEPLVVHRGSSAALLGGLTDPDEIMQRLGGRTVRDKAFLSTSAVIGSNFNGDIHYKITVPAGKGRGAFIRPMSHFDEENEYLIKRGAGLVVKKAYKDKNGKTVVELTMNG